MEGGNPAVGTTESEPPSLASDHGDETPRSATEAQDANHGAETGDEKGAAPTTEDFAGAMQAIISQVHELKRRMNISTGAPEPPRPQPTEEMKQYQRMESYLYQNRKEWQAHVGTEEFDMEPRTRDLIGTGFPPGPWTYHWNINPNSVSPYIRPDPFARFENANNGGGEDAALPVGADPPGEFDHIVDYGNRRDRLRKTFEWEMDRLYLAEETELRRLKKLEELEKEKKQKAAQAAASRPTLLEEELGDDRDEADGNKGAGEAAGKMAVSTQHTYTGRLFAEPTLNRTPWYTFKMLASAAERHSCVIDILVGDVVIDDDDSTSRWFDYLRRRNRKPSRGSASALAAQAATRGKSGANPPEGLRLLPERIRIHSMALLTIIDTILGSQGSRLLTPDSRPVVFLRPFKTLVYCESALREWHTTLERKFNRLRSASKVGEEGSGDSATQEPSSQAEGAKPQPVTVEEVAEQDQSGSIRDDEKKVEQDAAPDRGTPATSSGVSNEKKDVDAEKQGNEAHEDHDKDEESDDEGDKVEDDDPNDITKSENALSHLKCLLDFMDNDIKPKKEKISGTDYTKVHFSDLWHLFRPGMEVIQNDGKQAYRVLHITNAKHRRISGYQPAYDAPETVRAGRSNNEKRADFSLTCVYIDFNGKHIGPVLREFEFKRYEGERPLTSLEVYPLRFHALNRNDFTDAEWKQYEKCPEDQRFRQKLIRRGAMFLDVARVKHMYYAGPTLDAREEVESQVVVDFDTAFSFSEETKRSESKSEQRPELEVLVGTDYFESNDDRNISCHTCCKDDVVFDDALVDDKQTKEYIERLLPPARTQLLPSVAIVPRLLEEVPTDAETGAYSLPEEDLLIMSFRVHGFVLRSRKWAKLDLTYLTDVKLSGALSGTTSELSEESGAVKYEQSSKEGPQHHVSAFDRLVLPEGHKPMIISLIAQHFRNKESKGAQSEQVDIVMGKGKGLILLLHGAPGVGKTSTAEGVAELFRKPLFQITCGDLGTTANEVEKALETNFALASRWGCILLLDEADVFLAERTKEDFKRNGLVAVFLRVLEYYTGILFLTTNRIGDFDEAFTSRIHISLYYPELNHDKTLEVFKLNMELIKERFSRQKQHIEIDMMGVGSFASKHFNEQPHARWNGRQIRNACQTALALAEFEAQGNSHMAILRPDAIIKLTVEHFNTVRNAYLEFTKYMTDLYGSSAARRAKEGRLRAIWLDENDRMVGAGSTDDRAAAFLRATQTPLSSPGRQPPPGRQAYYQQYENIPRRPGAGSQGYPQPHEYQQDQYQGYYQQQQQQQQQQSQHGLPRQPPSTQAFQPTDSPDRRSAQPSRSPQPQDSVPFQTPLGQQFFAARQPMVDLDAGANRTLFQGANVGDRGDSQSSAGQRFCHPDQQQPDRLHGQGPRIGAPEEWH